MDDFHQLSEIFMECINIEPAYVYKGMSGEGVEVGWMVAKAKAKEARQQAVEFRVDMTSTCTYPQRTNISLQGLERCVLTMRAVSGPHCQIGTLLWHHFTSGKSTWSA